MSSENGIEEKTWSLSELNVQDEEINVQNLERVLPTPPPPPIIDQDTEEPKYAKVQRQRDQPVEDDEEIVFDSSLQPIIEVDTNRQQIEGDVKVWRAKAR